MGISFWQVAIVVVLVVLLFGRGKISSLMGDVAKGIKSFKKGMATDPTDEKPKIFQKILKITTIKILQIKNKNATNWLVRTYYNNRSFNCNNWS